MRFLGTHPFSFGIVEITPRGRYELERQQRSVRDIRTGDSAVGSEETRANQSARAASAPRIGAPPPSPVGSPYGFNDEDWEIVSERKADTSKLRVVLGLQFQSEFYDTDQLRANVEAMFATAVREYNASAGAVPVTLEFQPLAAGYGEHLFNEIARDIISADIAVLETSDLNPNVMLEFGVALTWGVRVLPIKREGRPQPPSDVSGQTWADYRDSASSFPDPDHARKLRRIVERAARKKSRA